MFAAVVHIVVLAVQWKRFSLLRLAPFLICCGVLVAAPVLGYLMPRARFFWERERYEAVANGIHAGLRSAKLRPDESDLGLWVSAIRDRNQESPSGSELAGGPIVAVDFLTVSHGFAGHVGFMRVFDRDVQKLFQNGQELHGWKRGRPISEGWYIVFD